MKRNYLSNFLPEKGYLYYFGKLPRKFIKPNILHCNIDFSEDNIFSIWDGYFNSIYQNIFDKYSFGELPLEFKEYHTCRDFDTGIRINVIKTLCILEGIENKKLDLDADECLMDLIKFFKENISKEIFIVEY